MCASYVRGDSMEPTLFDNDIILYDNFGYDGTDGIYAINYRGAAFVKRLQRDKDCVHIISDNPKYKEMTEGDESQDFRVIGKVRYVMHKVQGQDMTYKSKNNKTWIEGFNLYSKSATDFPADGVFNA